MNTYEFEATGVCPHGKLNDRYLCTLKTPRFIATEDIVGFIAPMACEQILQEQFADRLRNEFLAVTTVVGWHHGVKITCVRE